MSDISWGSALDECDTIRVVSANSCLRAFAALETPSLYIKALVHWIPSLERSVPHLANNCKWCQYPTAPKVYLPVVMCPDYLDRAAFGEPRIPKFPLTFKVTNRWVKRVLELPVSAFGVLKLIDRGRAFAIVRGQGKLSKKVLFSVFDNFVEELPPPWDVRPFLLKAWGISGVGF